MESLIYGISALFVLSSITALWYATKTNRLFNARERELHKLAYYDTLTGMANRLRFNEESVRILEQTRTNKQRCAILIIDLDEFKTINDSHGHQVGDEFLKQIATRLDDILNTHHDDNSFVARLGGDEFVMFLNDITNVNDVADFVHKIYEQFESPIMIDHIEIEVGLSIGISLYPYDGTTVSSLLKAADLALYSSKEDGKNTYFFHEHNMSTRFERLNDYQVIVRYFIETRDFHLRYQPIMDIKTGAMIGIEVLFGGNNIKYPSLNIQEMIEVAEMSEDILTLGDLILEQACKDFVTIIHQFVGNSFKMSVNISAHQLNDDQFVPKISTILARTLMPARSLCLEITETALMVEYNNAAQKMQLLNKIGVVFAIDDFGKEYSSMSHLRKLPVSKLKVDRSFIEDITDNKSSEIVRALVTITKTLGIECTAEGVETEEQYRFLKSIDCDMVQGYLLSPPLSVEQLAIFAKNKVITH